MSIEPEKFLCAFNARGWARFDANKLEAYVKRHIKKFKPQDKEENYCEDCQTRNNHIFHTYSLIDWQKEEYEADFAKTFNLDKNDLDEEIEELTIIQCSNCGNWRVAL